SVGVLAYKTLEGGHADDAQIKPKRPVLQIVEVISHALGHLLDRICLAAEPIHLGPPGDTRLDAVALHIAIHQGLELLIQGQWVRARPDNRHATLQNVDELW